MFYFLFLSFFTIFNNSLAMLHYIYQVKCYRDQMIKCMIDIFCICLTLSSLVVASHLEKEISCCQSKLTKTFRNLLGLVLTWLNIIVCYSTSLLLNCLIWWSNCTFFKNMLSQEISNGSLKIWGEHFTYGEKTALSSKTVETKESFNPFVNSFPAIISFF